MNKAANIYWDDQAEYISARRSRSARNGRRKAADKAARRTTPWWLSFLIATSMFAMLCVSINFRAFSEMREEIDQNTQLTGHIQNLMDENLALQEEMHTLKTDPRTIQREAKRIGIDVKVPVPTN